MRKHSQYMKVDGYIIQINLRNNFHFNCKYHDCHYLDMQKKTYDEI